MLIECTCRPGREDDLLAHDATSRWSQEQQQQHHQQQYPLLPDPRRHRDRDSRRYYDNYAAGTAAAQTGAMPTRRLPNVRGGAAGANVEQWRSRVDSRGYRPDEEWYFNSPAAEYHPQRLMRAVDGGIDGFQLVRGWRNRYEDDFPPERTELFLSDAKRRVDGSTSSSRHRLDATFRNDSLSSDPSDCVTVPSGPPTGMMRLTPKHHRRHKGHQHGVTGAATSEGPSGTRRQSS